MEQAHSKNTAELSVLQWLFLARKSILADFFSVHVKQGLQKMLQLALIYFTTILPPVFIEEGDTTAFTPAL